MTELLWTIFAASLIGSLHCAGMCGGVVALCVGLESKPSFRQRGLSMSAYHVGRLLSYTSLGLASGAVGAAVDFGASAAGYQRIAAWIAGGTMILIGILALARARGFKPRCIKLPPKLENAFQAGLGIAMKMPSGARSFVVGFLTALLPCGWLYAFVLVAAGTGSVIQGGLVMVTFWAGTVPILLAVGIGVDRIAAPIRRHVPTLTALALFLTGLITIGTRLAVPAYADDVQSSMQAADVSAETSIENLDQGSLPCCHDAE